MYGAATTEAVASAVVFRSVRRLIPERGIETSLELGPCVGLLFLNGDRTQHTQNPPPVSGVLASRFRRREAARVLQRRKAGDQLSRFGRSVCSRSDACKIPPDMAASWARTSFW